MPIKNNDDNNNTQDDDIKMQTTRKTTTTVDSVPVAFLSKMMGDGDKVLPST